MQVVTLAQLQALVRQQSDTRGLSARHPDADLTGLINRAARELRGIVTANGCPYFLTSTSSATLENTRVADEDYSEVPFPSGAEKIMGVEVQEGPEDEGGWRALQPIVWQQRRNNDFRYGCPLAFAVLTLPGATGNPTTQTAGTIGIFPYADSGRYKVWYLPQFTDLSASTDVFAGLPHWIPWIVQSVCVWLHQEDAETEMMSAAAAERNRLEAMIVAELPSVRRAGPLIPRRPRGRSVYGRRRVW